MLIGLVHDKARAPKMLESGASAEEIAVHGIDVDDIERMLAPEQRREAG